MSISHDTIVAEIRTLHTDLARWLGAPDASDALDLFEAQLHPDFSMVVMAGAIASHEQLLDGLRDAGNAMPGLSIDIVDVVVLHESPDCVVARFAEVHHRPDGPATRLTTAVLLPDPRARNGLRWRSVHETAAAH
ncbi:DUF4440 domain-containing protein [Nocardia sp. NPDC052566]|uniref:DUF4440 domain-containing protein n=1 Tax=Nocardia sp. NPDC052566 TaxID=3364330 RepID=UPI0037C60E44